MTTTGFHHRNCRFCVEKVRGIETRQMKKVKCVRTSSCLRISQLEMCLKPFLSAYVIKTTWKAWRTCY
ncbi:hypothetical protein P5673_018937 [Acropora cervicornis]|uniref:Uncharacterized protein n=1 Tax=Acropora cervicornis TaxID=6130 RepID=A0AAD9QD77_ACRCE|nr:hypothetical protein P5673_018937 [Acropora cervicornis]